MNELYFRDYDLFLDEQPDFGTTARLSEHAEAAGGDYPQEFPGGDDDNPLVVPASGETCTTEVQFPANLPAGTLFQVRPLIRLRNDTPCWRLT